MLLPPVTQEVSALPFQTATIVLPEGHAEAEREVESDCVIQGTVFSLHPSTHSSRQAWVVRSPSASGWDTLSNSIDIQAQWRLFLREIARLDGRKCFASSVNAQSLRIAIARNIPLPAVDVVDFMYSDQGDRFVDLAPGMQIKIQGLLPKAEGSSQPGNTPPMWTVSYDVVGRRGGGVRLKRKRNSEVPGPPPGDGNGQMLTVEQQFARMPFLRLFLQGFSDAESETGAVLIGASSAILLDDLTVHIRQTIPAKCVVLIGSSCVELPPGSVSLISFIWINGHRTPQPFGTPLAFLLFEKPEAQQSRALESVRVSRQLSPGKEAGVEFTRTMEGARQLLLLPGDRIEWKTE